jgi:hypothetical protein
MNEGYEIITTVGIWMVLSWLGVPMLWAGLTAITGMFLFRFFIEG